MGNNICSCDQKSSEASVAPQMLEKKRKTMAEGQVIRRDDSMGKLMPGQASALKSPTKETKPKLRDPEEEEETHELERSHNGGSKILTPTGVVANQSPVKHNNLKEPMEKAMLFKLKEKQLEERLRGQHCRPLLKLFKMMSTGAFQAEFGPGQEEELNAFIVNTQRTLAE